MVACSIEGLMFLVGVKVFGFGENFVALAGFCVDCSIDSAFLIPCGLPHAARVRWWPWAKLTIARALPGEQVTEEHDLRRRGSYEGLEEDRSSLFVKWSPTTFSVPGNLRGSIPETESAFQNID